MRYRNTWPTNWADLESANARSLRGRGWGLFSKEVRKARGNKCEVCGSPDRGYLCCHHILPVRLFRHLRFEARNCLVLCRRCHSLAETGLFGGWWLRVRATSWRRPEATGLTGRRGFSGVEG